MERWCVKKFKAQARRHVLAALVPVLALATASGIAQAAAPSIEPSIEPAANTADTQASAAPAVPEWMGALDLDARIQAVTPRVIAWRRDIHQHPELGNMEHRTSRLVAEHLRALGLDEVRTGIAHTGVLGVLKGGRPGGVVALRADMDALPIREATGLPFASRVEVDIDGLPTPVMHACGHDAHTAMLMAAAEVLAGIRDQIPGTVLFVFQPAEEGVEGETAGAKLMLEQGIFDDISPDVMFALHVEPGPVGQIDVRPGPFLASATTMQIRLSGNQTHGGRPWEGTDLVNLSADVVKSMATISSRQISAFEPHVVTIGSVQAGNRENILPGEAQLLGTIRVYNLEVRDRIQELIGISVKNLAETYGAKAEVTYGDSYLVTVNNARLLQQVLPALASVGTVNLETPLRGAAEDFSFFSQRFPSVFYILGSTPGFTTYETAPTNHNDRFDIDESVLPLGVRTHVATTLWYLESKAAAR